MSYQENPADIAKRLGEIVNENNSGFVVIQVSDLRYMLNQLSTLKQWRTQVRVLHDAAKVMLEDFPV